MCTNNFSLNFRQTRGASDELIIPEFPAAAKTANFRSHQLSFPLLLKSPSPTALINRAPKRDKTGNFAVLDRRAHGNPWVKIGDCSSRGEIEGFSFQTLSLSHATKTKTIATQNLLNCENFQNETHEILLNFWSSKNLHFAEKLKSVLCIF